MKTNKTYQKLEYRSLIVGLILTCITGILLFFIGKDETISEFDLGLTVILGLTTIAALSAFQQYSGNQINTDRIKKNIDKTKENDLEKKVVYSPEESMQKAIKTNQDFIKKNQELLEKTQRILRFSEASIQSVKSAIQKASLDKETIQETERK
jgi:membrane-bound lytic murein transglycosylase